MWYTGATYDANLIISGKIILIKRVNAEFYRCNKIFKPIIIAKHIS